MDRAVQRSCSPHCVVPSLEFFKIQLGSVPSNLAGVHSWPCSEQEVGAEAPKGSSQPELSDEPNEDLAVFLWDVSHGYCCSIECFAFKQNEEVFSLQKQLMFVSHMVS